MSKLFKISGYFKQNEDWGQAESAFAGEILMGALPVFWGYCEEFGDGDTMKIGATSYLAGRLFLKKDGVKLCFYKMYDNPPQDMLLCMVRDLKTGHGTWATQEESDGDFIERNFAQIRLEKIPYSDELEQKIYSIFSPALTGFPEMLAEEEAKICRK